MLFADVVNYEYLFFFVCFCAIYDYTIVYSNYFNFWTFNPKKKKTKSKTHHFYNPKKFFVENAGKLVSRFQKMRLHTPKHDAASQHPPKIQKQKLIYRKLHENK